MLLDQRRRKGIRHILAGELDHDGFPQVPGSHPRRIKSLDPGKHLLRLSELVGLEKGSQLFLFLASLLLVFELGGSQPIEGNGPHLRACCNLPGISLVLT